MASLEPAQQEDDKEKRLGGVEEGEAFEANDGVKSGEDESTPEGGLRAWATVLGG